MEEGRQDLGEQEEVETPLENISGKEQNTTGILWPKAWYPRLQDSVQ